MEREGLLQICGYRNNYVQRRLSLNYKYLTFGVAVTLTANPNNLHFGSNQLVFAGITTYIMHSRLESPICMGNVICLRRTPPRTK